MLWRPRDLFRSSRLGSESGCLLIGDPLGQEGVGLLLGVEADQVGLPVMTSRKTAYGRPFLH
jgi:hypothetical protein